MSQFDVRKLANASRVPSGDHEGVTAPFGSVVCRRRSVSAGGVPTGVPPAGSEKMFDSAPGRTLSKAMRVPSGDQLGALPGVVVT